MNLLWRSGFRVWGGSFGFGVEDGWLGCTVAGIGVRGEVVEVGCWGLGLRGPGLVFRGAEPRQGRSGNVMFASMCKKR